VIFILFVRKNDAEPGPPVELGWDASGRPMIAFSRGRIVGRRLEVFGRIEVVLAV
jgi:hypothetical protein